MPIDFPVFLEEPIKTTDIQRSEGKIQRVTNPDARTLIKRLQPYNAADPADNPLWLIHDFDIVDKHKELILFVTTKSIAVPREMLRPYLANEKRHDLTLKLWLEARFHS
jgi:hypothetical protein